MSDEELPTIGEAISEWLGIQLPGLPIPLKQTMKNIDKAISKVVLAGGENIEARIKASTAKAKARSKIDIEGIFRTEEEKRKFENRAAAMKVALEDIQEKPKTTDAPSEIEDDWLNLFVRVSEDKSSDELRQLFGKILSGEIRKPGSFSLRTMQLMATISKADAEALSNLLSYVIAEVIPFQTGDDGKPTDGERLFLEELGVAGHPSHIGGMQLNVTVSAKMNRVLPAIQRGLVIENKTDHEIEVFIPGQPVRKAALEIAPIANSPATNLEFLKRVAEQARADLKGRYTKETESGELRVHVANTNDLGEGRVQYQVVYTPT